MSDFSQAERSLRVETVLDPDVLLLSSFTGTEGVSRPFAYRVDLLSLDPNIVAADLLRTPMRIDIDLPDGGTRHVHGLVRSFTQLGRMEDLTGYRAEIVPWTWFLSLSRECRIHQNKNVPDIVATVFGDLGLTDFEDRCTRGYAPREYCVQYRESHLNFVSRLLEEEGIFTFFEHSPDGHLLVLADDNTAFQPVMGSSEVRMWRGEQVGSADGITTFEREHSAHVGRVTLEDYDWLQPQMSLRVQLQGTGPEELYDYHPRRYTTQDLGDRYSRLLLEEQEARREMVTGRATLRQFEAGRTFELEEHYREDANQEYVLLQVNQSGRGSDYRARDTPRTGYDVSFVAIPSSVPFRPPRTASKPVVQGPQTAEVVGKNGEEIWTDEHGRIKVQFHWDREGKHDEHSSCWVRVVSPWAGKRWGQIHIPRIGQEVVVEFLEGDPDRPLVTGSVYNAEQTPPWGLPSDQTRSGLKSRSSKGGGGYNEISIDDRKGSEQVVIHAQKDMSTTVLHDDTQSVHNDRTIAVHGTHTETITKKTTIKITEGDFDHDVVEGKATLHVKRDVTETFDENQSTTVGKKITISAGDQITLVTGKSSIVMKKDGSITIIGKNIAVEGTADVKVEAPKVAISGGKEAKMGVSNQQVTCDTTKVSVSGAAINSSAVGMHEIAGAVVKIN